MFKSDQKRAFIAVLLSGIVLFGWQHYFAPKPSLAPVEAVKTVPTTTDLTAKPATGTPAEGAALSAGSMAAMPTTIQPFTLKKDQFEFTITNDLTVTDMKNPNSVFDFKSLSDSAKPLKIQVVTDYGAMDLMFQMEQQGVNKLVGVNQNYGVSFETYIKERSRSL